MRARPQGTFIDMQTLWITAFKWTRPRMQMAKVTLLKKGWIPPGRNSEVTQINKQCNCESCKKRIIRLTRSTQSLRSKIQSNTKLPGGTNRIWAQLAVKWKIHQPLPKGLLRNSTSQIKLKGERVTEGPVLLWAPILRAMIFNNCTLLTVRLTWINKKWKKWKAKNTIRTKAKELLNPLTQTLRKAKT